MKVNFFLLISLTFPTHFCSVLFFPFLNFLSFYSFLPCSNSYCSILFYSILSFLFITTLFIFPYLFLLPILSHRFSISSNQIFFNSHLCESKTFFIRGMNTIISPTSLCPLTFPTHFCTVLFFPFLNFLSFYSFLPCSNSYCSILFYPILSFLFITTLFIFPYLVLLYLISYLFFSFPPYQPQKQ